MVSPVVPPVSPLSSVGASDASEVGTTVGSVVGFSVGAVVTRGVGVGVGCVFALHAQPVNRIHDNRIAGTIKYTFLKVSASYLA